MGKVLMSGGGGSVDLDVITAGAEHILAGTVGLDKEGEPLEGSMPDNSGIDTNGTVPGINTSYPHLPTREGSALQFSTTTDGSNVIALCPPQGYYPGGGGSYVHRPASDFGNATASKVLSGNTFTSENGIKLEGNVSVQSILSFSAAPYSSNQITFTWKNPAKGAFSGVIIRGKTGSYPTSVTDGTQWYKGSGNNQTANGTSTATVSGFTAGTKYYFKAFSYALKDNADWVASTTYEATATPTKGTKTFTSSTTWTVPTGVRKIDIFCVGGGGGSNTGNRYDNDDDYVLTSYGAGGAGYTATKKGVAVTPGTAYTVTIGAGGYGVNKEFNQETVTGGTTSFGTLLSAGGGCGGAKHQSNQAAGWGGASARAYPGNGGSGGGVNGSSTNKTGGSDGSNGGSYTNSDDTTFPGGKGQGKTTRAFGETSGTLYAGGGGGSGKYGAAGGSGGGGKGGSTANDALAAATAGSANTGGGGGGSIASVHSQYQAGAKGGSGICIIRWGY